MYAKSVTVEISPGELLDKITILEIKAKQITDAAKLRNVRSELARLVTARDRAVELSDEIAALVAELRAINEKLWWIEDNVRICEHTNDFGPRFIQLARSVYRTNDMRAALKQEINGLLGAQIVEEKAYAPHQESCASLLRCNSSTKPT